MRNAPSPSDRASLDMATIHAYSNNAEILDEDRLLVFLANNSKASPHDSKNLKTLRRQIASAKLASDHLINLGLSPILEAKIYLAVKGNK